MNKFSTKHASGSINKVPTVRPDFPHIDVFMQKSHAPCDMEISSMVKCLSADFESTAGFFGNITALAESVLSKIMVLKHDEPRLKPHFWRPLGVNEELDVSKLNRTFSFMRLEYEFFDATKIGDQRGIVVHEDDFKGYIDPHITGLRRAKLDSIISRSGSHLHWNVMRRNSQVHIFTTDDINIFVVDYYFTNRERKMELSENIHVYNTVNTISNPNMEFNAVLRNGMEQEMKNLGGRVYAKFSDDQQCSNCSELIDNYFSTLQLNFTGPSQGCDQVDALYLLYKEVLLKKRRSTTLRDISSLVHRLEHQVNHCHDLSVFRKSFKLTQLNPVSFDRHQFSLWTDAAHVTLDPNLKSSEERMKKADSVYESLASDNDIDDMVKDISFIRNLYILVFTSKTDNISSNIVNLFETTLEDFHLSTIGQNAKYYPFFTTKQNSNKHIKDQKDDSTYRVDSRHNVIKFADLAGTQNAIMVVDDRLYIINPFTLKVHVFAKEDLCYLANLYEGLLTQMVNLKVEAILHPTETVNRRYFAYMMDYIVHKGPQFDPLYFKNFGRMEELHVAMICHISRASPGASLNVDGEYRTDRSGMKTVFPNIVDAYMHFKTGMNKDGLRGSGFAFEKNALGVSMHYLVANGSHYDNTTRRATVWSKESKAEIVNSLTNREATFVTHLRLNNELVNNPFLLKTVANGFALISETVQKFEITNGADVEWVKYHVHFHVELRSGRRKVIASNDIDDFLQENKISSMVIINWWEFSDPTLYDTPYFVHVPFQTFLHKVSTLLEPLFIRFQLRRLGGHPVVSSSTILSTLEPRIQKLRSRSHGTNELIAGGFKLKSLNVHTRQKSMWPEILEMTTSGLPSELRRSKPYRVLLQVYQSQSGANLVTSPRVVQFEDSLEARAMMGLVKFKPFYDDKIRHEFMVDVLAKDKRICEDAAQTFQRQWKNYSTAKRTGRLQCYKRAKAFLGVSKPSYRDSRQWSQENEPRLGDALPFSVKSDYKVPYLITSPYDRLEDIETVAKLAVEKNIAFMCKLNEKERELKEEPRPFAALDGLGTLIFQTANRQVADYAKRVADYYTSGMSKKEMNRSMKRDLLEESSKRDSAVFNLSTDISKFCTSLRSSDMDTLCDYIAETSGSSLPKYANKIFKQHFVCVADPTKLPELDERKFLEFVARSNKLGPKGTCRFINYNNAYKSFVKNVESGNVEDRIREISDWLDHYTLTVDEVKQFVTGTNLLCEPEGFFEGLFQSLWTVWLCELQEFSRLCIGMQGTQQGSGDNQKVKLKQDLKWCEQVSGVTVTTEPCAEANKVGNFIKNLLSDMGVVVKIEESLLQASGSFFLKKLCIGEKHYMSSTPESLRQALFDSERNPNCLENLSSASTDLTHRTLVSHCPMGEIFNHTLTTEIFANVASVKHLLSNNETYHAHRETRMMSYSGSNVLFHLKNKNTLELPSHVMLESSHNLFNQSGYEMRLRTSHSRRVSDDRCHTKRKIAAVPEWVTIFLMQSIPLTLSNLQGSTSVNGPFDHDEQRSQNCLEAFAKILKYTPTRDVGFIRNAMNAIYNLPIIPNVDSGAVLRQPDLLETITIKDRSTLSAKVCEYIIKKFSSDNRRSVFESANRLVDSQMEVHFRNLMRLDGHHGPQYYHALCNVTLVQEALTEVKKMATRPSFIKTAITSNRKTFSQNVTTSYLRESDYESDRLSQRVSKAVIDDDTDDDYESDEFEVDEDFEMENQNFKGPMEEFLENKRDIPYNMIYSTVINMNIFKFLFCYENIPEGNHDPSTSGERLENMQKMIMGNVGKPSLVPFSPPYSAMSNILYFNDEISRDHAHRKLENNPLVQGVIRIEAHCDSFGPLSRITGLNELRYNTESSFIKTRGKEFGEDCRASNMLNSMGQHSAYVMLATPEGKRHTVGEKITMMAGNEYVDGGAGDVTHGKPAHRVRDVLSAQTLAKPQLLQNYFTCDTRGVRDVDSYGNKLRFDIQSVVTYMMECIINNSKYEEKRPNQLLCLGIVWKDPGPPALSVHYMDPSLELLSDFVYIDIGKRNNGFFEAKMNYEPVEVTMRKDSLVPVDQQSGSLRRGMRHRDLYPWATINVFLTNLHSDSYRHGFGVSNLKYFSFDIFKYMIKIVTIRRFYESLSSDSSLHKERADVKRRKLFMILTECCHRSRLLLQSFRSISSLEFLVDSDIPQRKPLKLLMYPNLLEYLVFSEFEVDFEGALNGKLNHEVPSFVSAGFVFYTLLSRIDDIENIYFLVNGLPKDYMQYKKLAFVIRSRLKHIMDKRVDGYRGDLKNVEEIISPLMSNYDLGCHNLESLDAIWEDRHQLMVAPHQKACNHFSLPFPVHSHSGFTHLTYDPNNVLPSDVNVCVPKGSRTNITEIAGENSATPVFYEYIKTYAPRSKTDCVIVLGNGVGFLSGRLKNDPDFKDALFICVDVERMTTTQSAFTRVERSGWVELQGDATHRSTLIEVADIVQSRGIQMSDGNTIIIVDVEESLKVCPANRHVVTKTMSNLYNQQIPGAIFLKMKGSYLHNYIRARFSDVMCSVSNMYGLDRTVFGHILHGRDEDQNVLRILQESYHHVEGTILPKYLDDMEVVPLSLKLNILISPLIYLGIEGPLRTKIESFITLNTTTSVGGIIGDLFEILIHRARFVASTTAKRSHEDRRRIIILTSLMKYMSPAEDRLRIGRTISARLVDGFYHYEILNSTSGVNESIRVWELTMGFVHILSRVCPNRQEFTNAMRIKREKFARHDQGRWNVNRIKTKILRDIQRICTENVMR